MDTGNYLGKDVLQIQFKDPKEDVHISAVL